MSTSTPHRIDRTCALPLGALLSALIVACGGGGADSAPAGDPLVLQVVDEHWYVTEHLDRSREESPLPHPVTATGRIDDHFDPHSIDLVPQQVNPFSGGNVFVDNFGIVYWTSAIAPRVDYVDPKSPIAYTTHLHQAQGFKKRAGNASLRMVISVMTNELMDSHTAPPSAVECPILNAGAVVDDCREVLTAQSNFKITAQSIATATRPSTSLAHGELAAAIYGYRDHWHQYAYDRDAASTLKYASPPDFAYDSDVDQNVGDHAKQWLKRPVVIEIPLDGVSDDGEFMVSIELWSLALNMRSGDAFAGAWFHDPQKATGVTYEGTGIEPLRAATPMAMPVLAAPTVLPAADCSGATDPAAGQVQFDAPTVQVDESSLAGVVVPVTRTGGSRGDLSVKLTMADGSAHAGVDYRDASALVRFADGEAGTRFVRFEPIDNTLQDGQRSATLALTELHGCGALGSKRTAAVTIFDDDQPLPVVPTYAIGGTVTGLVGSGLVLREQLGADSVAAANGSFTLPVRRNDGAAYDLRVATQPTNPIQICSVANGSGTVAAADVSNIAVNCTTPALNGALDAAFGKGGKVASNVAYVAPVADARMALALQGDGRVLLLGGLKLLRFNADGTPDTGFGTAGVATVPFNGSGFDLAQGLAVQADGRIVVAGAMSVGGQDDFALARFNTDGTLDTTFGSGGKVTTDFAGLTDRARRVVIQPDGRLVVAGYATVGTLASPSADFALARYNVDGSLDTTFAFGTGLTRASIFGSYDVAQGLALQADGKIVLAGRVAANGGTDPDVGLTRLHVNTPGYTPGERDQTFGAKQDGTVQTDLGLNSGWEEAVDLVVTSDGSLMAACLVRGVGTSYTFGLAKFNTQSGIDGILGSVLLTSFSTQSDRPRGLALQADGKLLMAGQSASLSTNPDMAIARYMPNGTSLDATFGSAGKLTVDFFGAIDGAEAVLVQPDGKIVIGGFARNAGQTVFAMARLMP